MMPNITRPILRDRVTSTALDHWAYRNKVQLDFSRSGKPVDNLVCEALDGSVRRECLSQHWFASIEEAAVKSERWRGEYDNDRPHSSLGQSAPAPFGGLGSTSPAVWNVEPNPVTGSASGRGAPTPPTQGLTDSALGRPSEPPSTVGAPACSLSLHDGPERLG